ncbi:MAG: class I SAM-dependent methyltransferase [Cyclobacteriaceae bacterium]
MNEEKHWNKVAPVYQEDVMDVFRSERNGVLPKYFKKHRNKKHLAIDFGCGVGNGFEFFAPFFNKVIAVDISQECLNIAKGKPYANIEFRKCDLTAPNLDLPKADFGTCVNVAILPEVEQNYRILSNVSRHLRKGGHAIFVIPSLDSMMFAAWRIIDLFRKERTPPAEIPDSDLDGFKGTIKDILQGIVFIEGVPTKHYSRPEIEVVFPEAGFKVLSVEKLEYDWTTEIAKPPKWLKAPYPWDWMVECKKQ